MSNKELWDALDELAQLQEQETKAYELENDIWWSKLSESEREHAFYAVVKRIHQGEIAQDSSYRYILYNIFNFGSHMYARGMDCGYLELHNCIYNSKEVAELRDARRNKTMTERIQNGEALRIDGGPAGVYYAETEQQYFEAITKLEALGANISIERL